MNTGDTNFSPRQRCPSCKYEAPMPIVAQYSQVKTFSDEGSGIEWEAGDIYQLLICTSCNNILLQCGFYHDHYYPDNWSPTILYPTTPQHPRELPEKVAMAYEVAFRVKGIDTNLFAVSLRRLLETICIDRGASGKTLYEQITDLSRRGDMPPQLAEMAHGLRRIGNIGAHVATGDLSGREVHYIEQLCHAILQYVYRGPKLLEQVAELLNDMKRQ